MLFGTFARRIGVTVGALALVVGGGAALAATSGSSSTIDGAATAGSAAFRVTTTTMAPVTAVSVPTTGGTLLFPMNPLPRCVVLNNFGDGRSGGRAHEGTDILATLGQEVYAVEDGVLYRQWIDGQPNTELSGNGWNLRGVSGTTYAFLHLSGFAPGLQVGSTVVKGQLIAYVGDTGNPDPGNYHLHFEVHPAGGAAVNAYPLLAIPTSCTKY
jgi:murein DD-endopeptidase MepM/ murein hydrolase activator NlpD